MISNHLEQFPFGVISAGHRVVVLPLYFGRKYPISQLPDDALNDQFMYPYLWDKNDRPCIGRPVSPPRIQNNSHLLPTLLDDDRATSKVHCWTSGLVRVDFPTWNQAAFGQPFSTSVGFTGCKGAWSLCIYTPPLSCLLGQSTLLPYPNTRLFFCFFASRIRYAPFAF